MILPAIDLGSPALLEALRTRTLEDIVKTFALAGEVALRDTTGDCAAMVAELVKAHPGVFRVEGVKDAESALTLLNAGAAKVIVPASALKSDAGFATLGLPKERVWAEILALPGADLGVLAEPLRELAGGFHFFYAHDIPQVDELAAFAKTLPPHHVSASGVINRGSDVAAIDMAGVAARSGTPLLTSMMPLADAIAASLKSDRGDGLWPTVIVDEQGVALGLAYSNIESLRAAVNGRCGAYHSRSRNNLWIKGATSGAKQELLGIALDCDRDALRFTVRQVEPGFCHENTWSCWGPVGGLPALSRLLASRAKDAPAGSYTRRLLTDPELLASKLREEAGELIEASAQNDRDEVVWEAADVIYFTLVHLAKHGIALSEVERHLDARHLKVTRRKGDAKPAK